jgi:hypothetical protein
MSLHDLIDDAKRYLQEKLDPRRADSDDPDAPFAMVGARLKPRLPQGHSSVSVQPER